MYLIVTTRSGESIMCNRVVFGATSDPGNPLAYLIVDNLPTHIELSEGASEMDVITIPKSEISSIKEVGATQGTLDFILELILKENANALAPLEPETVQNNDDFLLRGYN
ncbi:MAG: hypothetical protein PHT13_00420 [Methanosarcina sp.]|nr:hypothetical protein [Methanosarcina sp.]